jgi:hypothetical protein
MFKSIKRSLIAATAVLALSAPCAAFATDAGVGAAGIVVLLSIGAGAASVPRHRRAHRPVAG